MLAEWAAALGRAVRPRGTVTLALPAAALAQGVAALLDAGCGRITVVPLWPRSGKPARLVLLQGTRGSRTGSVLHPGLVLHEADGSFTVQTEAILRDAALFPASD